MSKSDKTLHIQACRICLDSKCINAVTIDYQTGWLQLFELCFGISLSTQDIPRSLCQKCANNVKKYSEFKELCHKSDILWKSLYNVKCFAEKLEPNNLVKDEVFDNEKNKNEIVSASESNNYDYVEQFVSDCNNFTDDTDEFIIKIKNENFESAISTNEVSISKMIDDEKSPSLLVNKNEVLKNEVLKRDSRNDLKILDQNEVKDSFTCKRCQKKYGSKLWYLKHLKSCNSNNTEHNPGTEVNLQDKHQILKTCKIMKKQQKCIDICGVCKFSSYNIDDMTRHLEGHWTNNDLECMICEFVAKDQAAIAAHRYNHYAAKTSSFLCHKCQKKTKSQLSLEFHYRKLHLNKIGGLCSQLHCDKVYDSCKLWKRHEKLHCHPGYVCDICGRKYKHKHMIAEHLINHINPPTHVCDICGKTFIRLRNLRVHIENVHVKSEPLKCSHCNRMFKNQNYLRSHLNYVAMEKIWKCEFCPMEYPMLSSLNSHLKSHSEERPHCCHICGSRYKAKSQLAIHMRNHTGDRPFKCTLCGKAFKSSQLLRRHTMIHTGILPYKCLHCEKKFRCKKRMMKHCTIRHKTQPIINSE